MILGIFFFLIETPTTHNTKPIIQKHIEKLCSIFLSNCQKYMMNGIEIINNSSPTINKAKII
jgi:hypothetical protein